MEWLQAIEIATNILKNIVEIGVGITIILAFINKKQWLWKGKGNLVPLQSKYIICTRYEQTNDRPITVRTTMVFYGIYYFQYRYSITSKL